MIEAYRERLQLKAQAEVADRADRLAAIGFGAERSI
jgi:hypothetical protein